MLTWLSLALSLVPELVKLFHDGTASEITEAAKEALTKALKDTTGAATPEEAKAKIKANEDLASDVKIKLAQIAADGEEKKRQDELQKLQAQLADQDKARQAQLDTLRVNIEDMKNARGTFADLAKSGSRFAWGAPIVSVVVTVGFFVILAIVLFYPPKSSEVVANVILGTLATAFTTVVTFWVGSAQSSRNKDEATYQLMSQQAQQTSDAIKGQTQAAVEIARRPPSGGGAAGQPAAKRNNFDACMEAVLKWEGKFGNDPQDRGGATNWGITKDTLEAWRGHSVTVDDVKNLPKTEAIEIFRSKYWNQMKCDDLPDGIDLVVFDFGVNAGVSRSAKMLQKIVGAEQDGSIGPGTVGATKSQDAKDVVAKMTAARLEYYRALPTFNHFGNGWTNRTNDIGQRALEMVKA